MAEVEVGTLDVNVFFLAIYFDGYGEKKVQPTIPGPGSAQTVPPLEGE